MKWKCNCVPVVLRVLDFFKVNMDIDDWRIGKSSSERYMHMFENQIGCDVTFSLGEERTISVHKFILISRSAVFETMFCGSLADKNTNKVIKIPDVEVDIFMSFLKFMYMSQIDLDDQNTLPMLYVARKYCVEDLVKICADFLRAKMTPETVCEILEQAHTYDISDLKNMCLQFIFENGNSVLLSAGFKELCFDCVQQIIKSNDLFVEESDVYMALTAWAIKECARRNLETHGTNKRAVLGNLIFKVRFPTMDRIFFTDVVSADDILTDAEKIALFQHMFGSFGKQDLGFPDVKREARLIKCMRFPKNEQGGISCEPGFKNSNFGIDVRSSEDIMLQGLILFGACSTSTGSNQSDSVFKGMSPAIPIEDQHVKIVVSGVPQHQSETLTFEYDNVDVPLQENYHLFLKEPVLLKKGRLYAIQVKLDLFLPYQTYSGMNGLTEVDSGSIRFNFYTHQSLIATTVEKGQIAGLLFSKLPDPERSETSLSPRGSPVKRDLKDDFRPCFTKKELFPSSSY
ncbi:BTB/POZ domain-containing protein 6-B-like isoform X2 [Ruditapes philippinarum]|uniref:BTB/POZ domain-containing protein 6-B-like isoform X2 n=1 Tax=Ruditapes philippinarum TaxID=129788 RepID=UPI00295A57ED|nr:BTB/POZ domain-containing protein 6-B-like isoform X2 [Ruditapes philippinarum]